MEYLLLFVYLAVLIFLIVLLIQCVKNKIKWRYLFSIEMLVVVLCGVATWYFDHLPGSGFMPGLQYLLEIVISFVSMLGFLILMIVSGLCYLICRRR